MSVIKAYHSGILVSRRAILCSKLLKQKAGSDLARFNPLGHGTNWTQMGLHFVKRVDIKRLNIWYYRLSIGKSERKVRERTAILVSLPER